MKISSFFLFNALLMACAFAAVVEMQADIVVTNDPTVPHSVQTGHVAVVYGGSDPKSRVDIKSGEYTVVEILLQSEGILYRSCGDMSNCDAESTTDLVQPIEKSAFARYTAASDIIVDGKTCNAYIRAASKSTDIEYLYADANGLTCRTVFKNGKVWTFSNVQKNVNGVSFEVSKDCPQPTCKRVMDIIFNLDASSSIDNTEWGKFKTFVSNFINLLDLGEDKTNIGIIRYNSKATVVSTLTANGKAAFNALDSWSKTGSGTCAGAGIDVAFKQLIANRSEKRKELNPATVIITISDGADSDSGGVKCRTDKITEQKMKLYNTTENVAWVGMGIGTSIKSNKGLLQVANYNKDFIIEVSDFNSVNDKLNALIAATCSAIPEMNLCGPTCKGFCTCEKECVVPVCEKKACKDIEAESELGGCIENDRFCGTDDRCTVFKCDAESDECISESTIPAEMVRYQADHCYDVVCNPTTGWSAVPKECRAPKNCEILTRDSNNESCCVYTAKTCKHETCFNETCDEETGECVYTKKEFAPLDACHTASCVDDEEVQTEIECEGTNMCKEYYCDENEGCMSKDILPSASMNDPCIEYTCDPLTGNWNQKRICTMCDLPYDDTRTNAEYCEDNRSPCTIASCESDNSYDYTCSYANKTTEECIAEVCPNGCDDGDPCTNDYCDTTNDFVCKNEPIDGCNACTANPCPHEVCKDVECNVTGNDGKESSRRCDYTDAAAVGGSCNGGNKCKEYSCSNDKCIEKDRVYNGTVDVCEKYVCDPATGTWTPQILYDGCTWCTENPCKPSVDCDFVTCDAVARECIHNVLGEAECAEKMCNGESAANDCQIATCNFDTKEWEYKDIPGCTHCTNHNNCTEQLCMDVTCVPDKENPQTAHTCLYVDKASEGGTCRGGNRCIVYGCNENGECTTAPLNYTNPDLCYNYVCNPSGDEMWTITKIPGCTQCTLEPDFCANEQLRNKCDEVICVATNSNDAQCVHRQIPDAKCIAEVCPGGCDDEDPCTRDYCSTNVTNLGCVHEPIDNCTACSANPCAHEECKDVKCVVNGTDGKASSRECVYTNATAAGGSCNKGDLCMNYGCNAETGMCSAKKIEYSGSLTKCQYAVCDPATGNFTVYNKVCEASSKCNDAECDTNDGVCKEYPKMGHEKCHTETCDESTGNWTRTERDCTTTDMCKIGYCDAEKDSCVLAEKECPYKKCKVSKCNSNAQNEDERCEYAERVCPGSVCYPGVCDPETDQCVNTTKCVETDFCYESICVGEGACATPHKKSPYAVPEEKKECFEYVCYSDLKEWKLEVIREAFLDSCGYCMKNFDQYYSGEIENTECLAGVTASEFGVGVGTVAAVAIGVAAAAGVAIVGTSGFFGTKELMRLAGANSAAGMSNNPLYEEDGVSVDNPMFEGTA